MTINNILDRNGDIKKMEMFSIKYKPAFFEISAIKNAVGNFVEKSQFVCGRTCAASFRDILPIGIFNAYG